MYSSKWNRIRARIRVTNVFHNFSTSPSALFYDRLKSFHSGERNTYFCNDIHLPRHSIFCVMTVLFHAIFVCIPASRRHAVLFTRIPGGVREWNDHRTGEERKNANYWKRCQHNGPVPTVFLSSNSACFWESFNRRHSLPTLTNALERIPQCPAGKWRASVARRDQLGFRYIRIMHGFACHFEMAQKRYKCESQSQLITDWLILPCVGYANMELTRWYVFPLNYLLPDAVACAIRFSWNECIDGSMLRTRFLCRICRLPGTVGCRLTDRQLCALALDDEAANVHRKLLINMQTFNSSNVISEISCGSSHAALENATKLHHTQMLPINGVCANRAELGATENWLAAHPSLCLFSICFRWSLAIFLLLRRQLNSMGPEMGAFTIETAIKRGYERDRRSVPSVFRFDHHSSAHRA